MDSERLKKRQIFWSDAEVGRLQSLSITCTFPIGAREGITNFVQLAQILNQEFHEEALCNGHAVRSAQNCFKKLEQLDVERNKQQRFFWSSEELQQLQELVLPHTRTEGRFSGQPDYPAIAEQLNKAFHADELERGIAIRTSANCRA